MKSSLAGEKGTAPYLFRGAEKFAVYAPVELKKLERCTGTDLDELLATSTAICNSTLLVTLITLSCVVVIIYFASRSIIVPINQAVANLKYIAEGEGGLTKRLPATAMMKLVKWPDGLTRSWKNSRD